MKRTITITALIVIVTSISLIFFVRATSGNDKEAFNIPEVRQGSFEIAISSSGELVAESSVDVRGPNLVQNMNFRMAPVRLTDIVPEGTIVSKGEYIATLDRSSFANTLKDELDILRQLGSDFEMKLLDTTVVLTTLRDDIRNQSYAMEEASIALEQSKYEPPAIQRQAQLELDKTKRFLEYKQRLYNLRYIQSSTEARTLRSSLERQKSKVKDLEDILDGFIIRAPSDGMVMYKKDRTGVKRKAGSMISPFDPVIATLPDMSSLLSKVYISEVDVNKVRPGQKVQITVDALSGKSFTGVVSTIANIGEQLANSDSKVFEVNVKIDFSDPLLRPSMTSGNRIILKAFENVTYVPAESVHAGIDSIPFVYTREGTKQVVILGAENDKNIIIEKGLEEGTSVWLSTPENPSKYMIAGSDLIPVIRDRVKARKLEMEREMTDNNPLTQVISDKKFFPSNPGQSGSSASTGGF